MNIKRKLLIGAFVVLGIAFVSGVTILAAGNYGTQTDPLVTLSYLTGVYKPSIMNELEEDAKIISAEMTAELDAKIDGFKTELETSGGGVQNTEKPDGWTVVTLKNGQTVSCPVGAEIMLRIGSANGNGSSPSLVDSTSGSTLSSGSALVTNHMYLVTIEGNGLKAVTDTVKVLIRGEYKVS